MISAEHEFVRLQGSLKYSDSMPITTLLLFEVEHPDIHFLTDRYLVLPPLPKHARYFFELELYIPSHHHHQVLHLWAKHEKSSQVLRWRIPMEPVQLIEYHLFFINDFHGHIGTSTTRVKDAPGMLLAAQLTRKRLEYKGCAGTAFFTVGDNVGGSPFESASLDDRPTIELLNALGTEVSVLGNHEFDRGVPFLKSKVLELAAFPYLGANVQYLEGNVSSLVDASKIIELGSGPTRLRIGFIGAVTADVPHLVAPRMVDELMFGNMTDAINREVSELLIRGDVDLLIVLAHQGAHTEQDLATLEHEMEQDSEFAEVVRLTDSSVAAVVTAHTHKEYSWIGVMPSVRKKLKDPPIDRPVIQSKCYGAFLGDLKIEVDKLTRSIFSVSATNHRVTEGFDDEILKSFVAQDPQLQRIKNGLDDAIASAAKIGAQQVGVLNQPLTHRTRSAETPLCNVVADGLLDTVRVEGFQADFSMHHSGGVRANLEPPNGIVTRRDIVTVLSFANSVKVLEISGRAIVDLLEEQWRADGLVLRLCHSGLTYWYDSRAPRNARIDVNSITIGGEPFDLDATYKMVTTEFLAAGGDKFTKARDHISEQDTPFTDDETLARYIARHSPLNPVLIERAIDYATYVGNDIVFTYHPKEGDLDVTITLIAKSVSVDCEVVILNRSQDIVKELARIPRLEPNSPYRFDVQLVAKNSRIVAVALVFDNNPLGHGIEASKRDHSV